MKSRRRPGLTEHHNWRREGSSLYVFCQRQHTNHHLAWLATPPLLLCHLHYNYAVCVCHLCVFVCICLCVCVRERERERESHPSFPTNSLGLLVKIRWTPCPQHTHTPPPGLTATSRFLPVCISNEWQSGQRAKWHPIPYVVHNFWPVPWVPFGTQATPCRKEGMRLALP
jgi:hypothetical protein